MNVEAAVIEAVGPELGGMLQAGSSRNEEIVTDERRWLRDGDREPHRRHPRSSRRVIA